MSSLIVADVFVEDRAHEEFLKAMVSRISKEEEKTVAIRVRSARGGHGRALNELSIYQKSVVKASNTFLNMPDLLFVAIDSNCKKFNEARKEIETQIEPEFKDISIIACPDPHIERWFLADPESFADVIGVAPKMVKKKCERSYYKTILSKAIMDAGYPPTLGGIEFAHEIVESMNLYRAGKAENSLKHFIDDAITRIRSIRT